MSVFTCLTNSMSTQTQQVGTKSANVVLSGHLTLLIKAMFAGVPETPGSEVPYYDAPERQEEGAREQRAASEAPPVIRISPPAPPASPALSAPQNAPETPSRARYADWAPNPMSP